MDKSLKRGSSSQEFGVTDTQNLCCADARSTTNSSDELAASSSLIQMRCAFLDIYIHNTSIDDWSRIWNFLLVNRSRLLFIIDTEMITLPLTVGEAFNLRFDPTSESLIWSPHLRVRENP